MSYLKFSLIFCIFLVQSKILTCQNIVTDRPDQTESATSLSQGYFQIETGTTLEIIGAENLWTINSTLLRYGILKNLEMRLGTALVRTKNQIVETSRTGISDIEAGFKYQFLNKGTEIAYLGHLLIPSGSSFIGLSTAAWTHRVAISHELSDRISIAYNLGHEYIEEENNLVYSLAIGVGLTEKIGFYTEIFGGYEELDDWVANYDNGITVLIRKNIQLDFSFGTGVTDRSNYYSAGFSWRFPD